jgi:hypothetical protein
MAYVPCRSCDRMHKNILQSEVVEILDRFQKGDGQRVTKHGIESMCVLDVLDLPEEEKKRRDTIRARILSHV